MGQSLDTIDAPPHTTSFCMPEPGERFPPDFDEFPGLPGGRRPPWRLPGTIVLPDDDPNKPPDPNEWIEKWLPKLDPDWNPNDDVHWFTLPKPGPLDRFKKWEKEMHKEWDATEKRGIPGGKPGPLSTSLKHMVRGPSRKERRRQRIARRNQRTGKVGQ